MKELGSQIIEKDRRQRRALSNRHWEKTEKGEMFCSGIGSSLGSERYKCFDLLSTGMVLTARYELLSNGLTELKGLNKLKLGSWRVIQKRNNGEQENAGF